MHKQTDTKNRQKTKEKREPSGANAFGSAKCRK